MNSTHDIYRPNAVIWDLQKRDFLESPPTKLRPPDIISFRTTGYWNRCCGSARSALAPEIRLLWFRLFSLGHLLVNLTSEPWWCQAGKLSSALPHICDTADLLSFLFFSQSYGPQSLFSSHPGYTVTISVLNKTNKQFESQVKMLHATHTHTHMQLYVCKCH